MNHSLLTEQTDKILAYPMHLQSQPERQTTTTKVTEFSE